MPFPTMDIRRLSIPPTRGHRAYHRDHNHDNRTNPSNNPDDGGRLISLTAKLKYIRWANLDVPLVFLLFNVQYLVEYSEVWNYILGIAYILFNILIICNAWKMFPE